MINVPERRSALMGDRYRLQDVLGRGGVADVYRATDEVLHRTVAVKVFRFEADGRQESQRIEAEMHLLASLSHPGLVTLFDAGVSPSAGEGDVPYLVMELVDGTTLRGMLTGRGRLNPLDAAQIGRELADTLAYVHRQGVVHRDIKPANILMGTSHSADRAASAKLADFGIARLVDGARLTAHGAAVGTAHYLSPEQATGAVCGPPGDVYSLGLVLIECLTGEMAFSGEALSAALARLHRDPHIPTEFGADWARVLADMTARDPAVRPDASQVAVAMAALVESEKQRSATAVMAESERDTLVDSSSHLLGAGLQSAQPRRRGLLLAILGGVAALVAVLAIVGLTGGSGGETAPQPTTSQAPLPTAEPAPSSAANAPAAIPTTAPAEVPTVAPAPVVQAPVVQAPVVQAPVVQAPAAPPAASNGNGKSNGNGNSGNGNGNGKIK